MFVGLYGHTAVLHQLPNNNDPAVIYLNPGFESRSSIYIYGGILPLHPYAKNKPSSDSSDLHQDEDQTELWVLNLRNAHWSVLSPSTNALVQVGVSINLCSSNVLNKCAITRRVHECGKIIILLIVKMLKNCLMSRKLQ